MKSFLMLSLLGNLSGNFRRNRNIHLNITFPLEAPSFQQQRVESDNMLKATQAQFQQLEHDLPPSCPLRGQERN